MVSDIKKALPKNSATVKAIYQKYKEKADKEPDREYLGGSIIGHVCSRYLWYMFRWCVDPDFDGRMHRLFDRGYVEEERIEKDLKDIGCEVYTVNEKTGEQFGTDFINGHCSLHIDGCVKGVKAAPKTWHNLEIKTHSKYSYEKLVKDKVQISKPQHYGQVQLGMYLLKLTRTLYIACNKNTDELYSERIKLDKEYAKRLIIKAEQVVKATKPPMAFSDKKSCYECKYCPASDLCHGNTKGMAVPCRINCRTCICAGPLMKEDHKGEWACNLKDKLLSFADQQVGCERHLFAPGIVSFAELLELKKDDKGNIYAEYRNDKNGLSWINGNDLTLGHFSSLELSKIPYKSMIDLKDVQKIKTNFDAKIVKEK